MRQKLITLCPNSFEIAQKKPNFSAWVRKKLLEENPKEEKDPIQYVYKCPCCKITCNRPVQRAWNCEHCTYPLKFMEVY